MDTVHYVAPTNDRAACGTSKAEIYSRDNLISFRAKDVTCTACKQTFDEMSQIGFFPRP